MGELSLSQEADKRYSKGSMRAGFALQLGVIFQVLILFSGLAHATTFVKKTFEKAVSDSEGIVRGTVGINYPNWAQFPDGSRRICTFTELTIEEVLKGDIPVSGKLLLLRELGGSKDGVSLQIPGQVRFGKGEEVVVFIALPPNSDGSFTLNGMELGKYTFMQDEDGSLYLTGGRITQNREREYAREPGATPLPVKRWTLASLRKLIQDQRGPKNTINSNTYNMPPPTAPGAVSSPAPSLAPRAETRPEKGSGLAWGSWVWGLGLLGLLAAVIWFFVKR